MLRIALSRMWTSSVVSIGVGSTPVRSRVVTKMPCWSTCWMVLFRIEMIPSASSLSSTAMPCRSRDPGVGVGVADGVVADEPGHVRGGVRRLARQHLEAVRLRAEGGVAVDVEGDVGVVDDAHRHRHVVVGERAGRDVQRQGGRVGHRRPDAHRVVVVEGAAGHVQGADAVPVPTIWSRSCQRPVDVRRAVVRAGHAHRARPRRDVPVDVRVE